MTQMNFTPFPTLTTERLMLRQLSMEDENEIFALRSDDRVNEFLGRAKANTVEDARKFIEKINDAIRNNESIYWAIILKSESKLIGTIMLWNISKEESKAEMGLELHPDHQGKGLMQEAVAKVIEFGFSKMGLETIEGFTHRMNRASIKLLTKNNFKRDLKAEERMAEKEPDMNLVIYTCTRDAETESE